MYYQNQCTHFTLEHSPRKKHFNVFQFIKPSLKPSFIASLCLPLSENKGKLVLSPSLYLSVKMSFYSADRIGRFYVCLCVSKCLWFVCFFNCVWLAEVLASYLCCCMEFLLHFCCKPGKGLRISIFCYLVFLDLFRSLSLRFVFGFSSLWISFSRLV